MLVLGMATLAYYLVPLPPPLQAIKEAGERTWSLPTLRGPAEIDKAFSALQTLKPWGLTQEETKNAAATAVKVVQWYFRGVVRVGIGYFALIETEGKVRRYRYGDVLPDGRKLTKIDDDRIETTGPEGPMVTRLYQTENK